MSVLHGAMHPASRIRQCSRIIDTAQRLIGHSYQRLWGSTPSARRARRRQLARLTEALVVGDRLRNQSGGDL